MPDANPLQLPGRTLIVGSLQCDPNASVQLNSDGEGNAAFDGNVSIGNHQTDLNADGSASFAGGRLSVDTFGVPSVNEQPGLTRDVTVGGMNFHFEGGLLTSIT